MKGLYVHIPFCERLCTYCDFVKTTTVNDTILTNYFQRLKEELDSHAKLLENIDTIYIGGGTPSFLDVVYLEKLLILLKEYNPQEYTIEINPESYTSEKGQLFKKYHINRVSIGVETFNENTLKFLNRGHKNSDVFFAIADLREKGITNISIDLMFAIPYETLEDVYNDLLEIAKLKITHVSYYSFILEENTKIYHDYLYKGLEMVDNEIDAQMYEVIITKLEELGFQQYEIANFAKKGYSSIHNLLYWTQEEYLGIGLGAHSFYANKRTHNSYILKKYLAGEKSMENLITQEELFADELIFGLRKISGVNIAKLQEKYQKDPFLVFPEIKQKIADGLLSYQDGTLRLTKKGIFFGNQVFMLFI